MDKQTFLETLKSARSELDAALALVNESQMTEPGVSGEMSVKDIIAHVTWYEREMVGVLEQRALVGSDLWDLPGDDRNAAILTLNRDRSLSDVREEAQQVFQRFITAVEMLDEDELNDPTRFRDMPADWIAWQLLAENSSEHYGHHAADIRNGLEKPR